MNNKAKKASAILAAAMIAAVSFTGCGKSGESSTEAPSSVKVDSKTVAEVDGVKLDTGLLNYYIYQAAVNEEYKANQNFSGDFSSVNWDEKDSDGKTKGDKIKESALKELMGKQLVVQLGKDNGVTLSDDEKNQATDSIEQFKNQYGEEALNANMQAMGLKSAEDYQKLYEIETLYRKVETDFVKNKDKYASVNLEEYQDPDQICVQHILIKNDSQKYSDPKATIDEVLARAKNGEDFTELMKEYNEDTGETEGGYCFGRGEMVSEFENAAFALNYNEISDVVKTEYGYHIIKRITGLAELKNYLIQASKIEKQDKVLKDISVGDVMKNIQDAMTKAKELNSKSTQNAENTQADSGK